MPLPRPSLPVIIPPGTGQNFSCHSCTRCCRDLVVELSEADRRRIDRFAESHGAPPLPYLRRQGRWVLNKRDDGCCVFLMEDGKCLIHAQAGFQEKPLACRLYPFLFVPTSDRIRVTWRFDCPSVAQSRGQPVREHIQAVQSIADELLSQRVPRPPAVQLQPGLTAEPAELDALDRTLDSILTQPKLTFIQKISGLVWITESLAHARLAKVRRDRFLTLMELLAGSWLEGVQTHAPPPPTPRHWSLFRQVAFAHSGFVSFAEMERGFGQRVVLRWRQFIAAERYRRGVGAVPRNQAIGIVQDVTFEQVDGVRPGSDSPFIGEGLLRYLRSRILARTGYGPAYYGWAATRGLAALWLAIAVLGWWCRCFAAADGRSEISADDFMRALALVDAAAGRIPALGGVSERLRTHHLLTSGVIGSLINQYLPIPV